MHAPPTTVEPRIRGMMGGSRALVSTDGIAARTELRARLAGDRPAAVEVGFGHGAFLVALARTRPDLDVVGLEVDYRWVRKAARRADKAGVPNVTALKGDARVLLSLDVPRGRLSHVYVLFPDPWWKFAHRRRRRVLTPEFLDVLARALRPGGTLLLRTDVRDYLDSSAAFLSAHPAFDGIGLDPAAIPGLALKTHREERCARDGVPVYQLAWARRAAGGGRP